MLDRDGRVAWTELVEEGLEVLRAPQRRLASAAHRRAVLDAVRLSYGSKFSYHECD